MSKKLSFAILVIGLSTGSVAIATDCGMIHSTTHSDPAKTVIYGATSGVPSLYFQAKMAVNTDGSSRSYHPDDPNGNKLALNNIVNAISAIYDPNGKNLNCKPRKGECYKTYIQTFEKARDANWKPEGAYRVETKDMIPWKLDTILGWKTPCTIISGPQTGYFVSQTAFIADGSKSICDQERYLDSLTYNAIVLPMGIAWNSQENTAKNGDIVVARNVENGKIAYAIVGDRGPANDLGEGTIALTASLRNQTLSGEETYPKIKKLSLSKAQYVVFSGENIHKFFPRTFTQADIDQLGKDIFERWGGIERLESCRSISKPSR